MFLDDFALLEMADTAIEGGINAEAAWMDSIEQFAAELAQLPDPDIKRTGRGCARCGRRVLRRLLGRQNTLQTQFEQPVVVVAQDLEPSQTAQMDRENVLAFCTAAGGPTSHTAILAKAMGIPAVVGLGEKLLEITPGTPLLVDGGRGRVTVRPGQAARTDFEQLSRHSRLTAAVELEQTHLPAATPDGHIMEVVANVGSTSDARSAIKFGAEGIGLLRTEFLYLERTVEPTEEEQHQAYGEILDVMGSRPVVVRTLDAGGDKQMPYANLGVEANPFLGLRAIRLCLQQPEMFTTQLRALLRAGVGHDLRIMFPMIATLDEFRQARAALQQAQAALDGEGLPHHPKPQIGIMVEISFGCVDGGGIWARRWISSASAPTT